MDVGLFVIPPVVGALIAVHGTQKLFGFWWGVGAAVAAAVACGVPELGGRRPGKPTARTEPLPGTGRRAVRARNRPERRGADSIEPSAVRLVVEAIRAARTVDRRAPALPASGPELERLVRERLQGKARGGPR